VRSVAATSPYAARAVFFNGLSTLVQTIGAVPAAWGVIQSFATALGLM
jgi:hypothetical protein